MYWLEDEAQPPPLAPLDGPDSADLVVVGGGYLGLWTALLAKQRDTERDVLLLEAATCGHAASGRNGGFCEASLTHGFGNGLSRWPDELDVLTTMGRENLDGIERTVEEFGIDCDFVRAGSLAVATAPYQLDGLREEYEQTRAHGMATTWLDADALRERVDSPTFLAGVHDPDSAILEPARLAWGLRDACLSLGVRIAEGTPVTGIARSGEGVTVETAAGPVHGRRVVLATNAYPPLLRRLRLMTVPVYDYALMTEPLTADQREAIGWRGREGISDLGNQFHYFRTTRDGRILWGGYDAIYHYGSGLKDEYDQRDRDLRGAGPELLHHVPAADRPGVQPCLGRRDRHLHQVRGVLRHRAAVAASATRSASLASVWARPGSRATYSSTCSPASTPHAPGWRWSARNPCPSHPSRPAG